MKRAVQFGAGAIGKSFLGLLYHDAGWETAFVEIAPHIVNALNERGGYSIESVGPVEQITDVRDVGALGPADLDVVTSEIARADLVGTSVGKVSLPDVARVLAAGIARRARERPESTLNVLICENLLDASRAMRELVRPHVPPEARNYFEERVGLVETVVGRTATVPKLDDGRVDPLRVVAEGDDDLPVNARTLKGPAPDVPGVRPVDDYGAHVERKLYGHNCGHALAAYLGARAGHEFIWQAVEDPSVRALVEAGMWESGRALCRRHGFARDEHAAYIEGLLRRFAIRALGDTVARVGRDPVRKLGPTDRLVGAARLAVENGEHGEQGERPAALAEGIAAAMAFRSPGDPSADELAGILAAGGPERVLSEVCGLDPSRGGDGLIRELVLDALERAGG
ncbi:MAG: mannitol dehydrogenase family protein [Planctomycetota bacterium]|jgi:mannitol-1-phosphate 5-dehydrogenase